MAKNTLSREAKRMGHTLPKPTAKPKTPPKSTLAAAKTAVVKGAEKVAEAVATAAEAVQDHVLQPIAEGVGIVKKPEKTKRARFVRPKQEKKAPTQPVELPPRSKKASGKLMTKNLKQAPKETPAPTRKGRSK